MKKIIYRIINKLGYRIENRNNTKKRELNFLSKFEAEKNKHVLFIAGTYIRNLDKYFKDLKIQDHNDGFIVSFSDVKIYVESAEEFFIINEVFIENDYNFRSTEQSVLIDIGANIGISSLFFSKLNQVNKIYSFEPVKDTYEQAKYNFSINEEMCKVAKLENFGIGKNDREETFIFNKKMKGNTGVRGKLSASYASVNDVVEKKVQIRNATDVFMEILNENQGKKIVVKMDCEGAEYEIFENITASGMIKNIDVFMIEWHDHGSEIIENALINAGFFIFSRRIESNTGMLYAIKNN